MRKEQFVDSEDAGDVLIEIEKSLGINLSTNEHLSINNIGQLCDFIQTKIELENINDCTSQQAFYKLRNAFKNVLKSETEEFQPDTELEKIIPRKNRRQFVNKIEQELGFQMHTFKVSKILFVFLLSGLIISIIIAFFYFIWGWIGIAVFTIAMKMAFDFRKELNVKTVRELTEKITREHYSECRRYPNTMNKAEIEKLVIDSFNHYLGRNESFTRETIFE